MAEIKVKIARDLLEEIQKKFKGNSIEIIDLLENLEKSPNKGKIVGQVGGLVIKEIRYESFRFYFIIDGDTYRLLSIMPHPK